MGNSIQDFSSVYSYATNSSNSTSSDHQSRNNDDDGSKKSKSQNQRQAKLPENIGSFLCDVNLMNYLSINFLYSSRFYLYFEVINRDFYEHVKEEEMKYIPSNYLNINLYRVYFDENNNCNTLQDHRKMLLNRQPSNISSVAESTMNFVLPSSVKKNVNTCRQWKILNINEFYRILEKAKNECHVHQLITHSEQKRQTKKFEVSNDLTSSLLISQAVNGNDNTAMTTMTLSSTALTQQVQDSDNTSNPMMNDDNVCCICLDAPITITTGCCNAQFCESCLNAWNQKNTSCPMCRKPLNITSREDKTNTDSWVTVQKEDFILAREEVANQFTRFINIILNPLSVVF